MMNFDFMFVELDDNYTVEIASTDIEINKRRVIDYMIECIADLTDIQKQRLYKYYVLNQSKISIAKEEQVSEDAVRTLINEDRICYIRIGKKIYIHYTKSMARLMLESDRALRLKSFNAA